MLVLGLMSGTPPNLNAKLLGQTSFTFPRPLRKEILRVAEQQPIGAGDLSRLNFRLGRLFAEAALTAKRSFTRGSPPGISGHGPPPLSRLATARSSPHAPASPLFPIFAPLTWPSAARVPR